MSDYDEPLKAGHHRVRVKEIRSTLDGRIVALAEVWGGPYDGVWITLQLASHPFEDEHMWDVVDEDWEGIDVEDDDDE